MGNCNKQILICSSACPLLGLGKRRLKVQTSKEARLFAVQIRLVSEKKLKRILHRQNCELRLKIFDMWDEYEPNVRSAKSLLRACSYLSGPMDKTEHNHTIILKTNGSFKSHQNYTIRCNDQQNKHSLITANVMHN